MQHVNESRLESDLNYRYRYLAEFIGFGADLSLGLERGQEVRTVRAFNKLLWLQNDLINRHYP